MPGDGVGVFLASWFCSTGPPATTGAFSAVDKTELRPAGYDGPDELPLHEAMAAIGGLLRKAVVVPNVLRDDNRWTNPPTLPHQQQPVRPPITMLLSRILFRTADPSCATPPLGRPWGALC